MHGCVVWHAAIYLHFDGNLFLWQFSKYLSTRWWFRCISALSSDLTYTSHLQRRLRRQRKAARHICCRLIILGLHWRLESWASLCLLTLACTSFTAYSNTRQYTYIWLDDNGCWMLLPYLGCLGFIGRFVSIVSRNLGHMDASSYWFVAILRYY